MRKILSLLSLCISLHSYSQSYQDAERVFTAADFYKWRKQMNFQPRYVEARKLDNVLLGMNYSTYESLAMKYRVTYYEHTKRPESSLWFVFKDQLKEYYGDIPEDYIAKWYVPLFVFLECEKVYYQNYIEK